jgi:hypothetical protein
MLLRCALCLPVGCTGNRAAARSVSVSVSASRRSAFPRSPPSPLLAAPPVAGAARCAPRRRRCGERRHALLSAMEGLVSRETADHRISHFPPAQHSTTCAPQHPAVEATARRDPPSPCLAARRISARDVEHTTQVTIGVAPTNHSSSLMLTAVHARTMLSSNSGDAREK